jgi:hypothetical protein
MRRQDQDATSDAPRRPTNRRPYRAPELTTLGSIEELTRGGSGASPDGGFGRRKN